MQSCETDDKTIDDVFNNIERGAVLRTVDILNPTFDFYDTSSQWIASLEAQDSENGDLLSEIKIYLLVYLLYRYETHSFILGKTTSLILAKS